MEEQGRVLQVVVFQLGDELYGADIAVVREVGPMQRVTRVPRTPRYIEGVTNLRGRVIPVIDLRRRLGLPVTPFTKQTRIAVAELEGGQVGMIVDSVQEVLRIPADAVEPATGLVSKLDSESISGVAKMADRLIVLLDLAHVLQRDDRKVAG